MCKRILITQNKIRSEQFSRTSSIKTLMFCLRKLQPDGAQPHMSIGNNLNFISLFAGLISRLMTLLNDSLRAVLHPTFAETLYAKTM